MGSFQPSPPTQHDLQAFSIQCVIPSKDTGYRIVHQMSKPQSTYYRGRVEIGEVYLPCQLERTLYNFVRDGRYSERGWACKPTLTRRG